MDVTSSALRGLTVFCLLSKQIKLSFIVWSRRWRPLAARHITATRHILPNTSPSFPLYFRTGFLLRAQAPLSFFSNRAHVSVISFAPRNFNKNCFFRIFFSRHLFLTATFANSPSPFFYSNGCRTALLYRDAFDITSSLSSDAATPVTPIILLKLVLKNAFQNCS